MNPYREIFYLSLLTTVIVLSNSCAPKFGGPNPQNYEDYVGPRDKQPAFSPDGKQIAYYHDSYEAIEPADYPSGLYIVNADGTNRIKVLSGHHYSSAWPSDGQWLVFSTQGVIQKRKVNGDSLTRFEGIDGQSASVEDGLFFPDCSPLGNKIFFSKSDAPEGGLYYTTSDFSKSGRMFDLQLETGNP